MLGIYLCFLLGGMIVGLYIGVTTTVKSIKKEPEKWEQFGIILDKKTGSYTRGWIQGWKEGCESIIKDLDAVVNEQKLAEELAE